MYELEKSLYVRLGKQLADMLCEKRDAYGDNLKSTGEFLRILYPEGIPPSAYDELATVIRVMDKLFRIANKQAHDTVGDAWKDKESPRWDVAGYGLAMVVDRTVQLKPGVEVDKS